MPTNDREFDLLANSYRETVNGAISFSGEDLDYFASGRVAWLKKILASEPDIHRVMDFGCGVGLGGGVCADGVATGSSRAAPGGRLLIGGLTQAVSEAPRFRLPGSGSRQPAFLSAS